MSLVSTIYQPKPVSSHYNTPSSHVATATTSHSPIEGVSDALWGMKSSFAEDPNLKMNVRKHLDSRVDTLCGYPKTSGFSIPPSQASAMESLITAVDLAQASLADTMSEIPLSEREQARHLSKEAYRAVLDLVASTPAPSTSRPKTRPTSAMKSRAKVGAPKSVKFSQSPTTQISSAGSPSPSTIFTQSERSPLTIKRESKSNRARSIADHSRSGREVSLPVTSVTPATSLKSRRRPTSTNGSDGTSSRITKPRNDLQWPSGPAKSQHIEVRRPPRNAATSPELQISAVPSEGPESGMIPISEWIERARVECLRKTGTDGGWGNAAEWFAPSGMLGMLEMLQPSSEMVSQDWDAIRQNPMAWGTPRRPGVTAPISPASTAPRRRNRH
jgi:hypothetical protein